MDHGLKKKKDSWKQHGVDGKSLENGFQRQGRASAAAAQNTGKLRGGYGGAVSWNSCDVEVFRTWVRILQFHARLGLLAN